MLIIFFNLTEYIYYIIYIFVVSEFKLYSVVNIKKLKKTNTMKAIKLKDVKKGEFFKLRPIESAPVWVRGSYDRMEKKYECYQYYESCHFDHFGANKIVYVVFEF